MKNIEQFENQQYLNIETFRKNGQGVKTPVWFARDGETLRIWTQADAGKAKRIRQDGKVRIVPSTASGEPVGEWTDAKAAVLVSSEEVQHTAALFKQKYGLMFNVFGVMGKLRGAKFITIQVELG
ncbi:MAG: PPOX class F420-dependent oxidoreductase [Anaerolineales bacterium]